MHTLLDIAEWVGEWAAWDGTAEADAYTKGLQQASINAVGHLNDS